MSTAAQVKAFHWMAGSSQGKFSKSGAPLLSLAKFGVKDMYGTIDLYHTAAILSPRRTKSFVFARAALHWVRGLIDTQNRLLQQCVIKFYCVHSTK